MKNIAFLFAASLSLAACGSKEDKVSTEKTETPEATVEVDAGFVDNAGRWVTQVSQEKRLIIDIASNGRFSMDVRKKAADGKEAVVENANGKAAKSGSLIIGTIDQGPGVHDVLKNYANWQIDATNGSGTIAGNQKQPIAIKKEKF